MIFTVVAIQMTGSRGWIYGASPMTLAIAFPFLSYLSRSADACGIELDSERQTITQIFKRFGKTKRITLNARLFSAFRLSITTSRFPKATLLLHARDSSVKDVQLALMDTKSSAAKLMPTDTLPQVLLDIASVLEKSFFLVNISNESRQSSNLFERKS